MSDLYRIKIIGIVGNELVAKVYLHNTQAPDLPAKKNIGLQLLTDSFFHMVNMPNDLNLEAIEIEALLEHCDRTTLMEYDQYIHDSTKVNYEQYIAIAEQEIEHIEITAEENWETVASWEEEIYEGVSYYETKTPVPATTFLIKVFNKKLLKHLTEDLEWTSPMWDRTEGF